VSISRTPWQRQWQGVWLEPFDPLQWLEKNQG
jgi:hypothetical protein